ncbi:thermonuclease family protein [Kiritimatiella glycovorans]|uniref:TNase-like domain-containing protein n=1 Tax=Kiritimatiella glycovorans TaxID=1307763 RepID=A0A0G3EFY4_9BACT|nr:hypothetical protein [Kiritimatiella glycovorans]AKJ63730.1 hypothetical protein L21SP4_00450 [Kiritimatiella glycovorans]
MNRRRWIAAAGPALLAAPAAWAARRWHRFTDGRLAENPYNDGDSFWIDCGDRDRKFRLYFCDAPECSAEKPWARRRLKEQAEYFGISRRDAVERGREAKRRTENLLAEHACTVWTRWDDAKGQGAPRWYALVRVRGRWLSEILVESGLAIPWFHPPHLRRDTRLPGGETVEAVLGRMAKYEDR